MTLEMGHGLFFLTETERVQTGIRGHDRVGCARGTRGASDRCRPRKAWSRRLLQTYDPDSSEVFLH